MSNAKTKTVDKECNQEMQQMLWISVMSMREPIPNLLSKNVADG